MPQTGMPDEIGPVASATERPVEVLSSTMRVQKLVIDRPAVVAYFQNIPADKQDHVRNMLSTSLRGIVSPQLLKKKDGPGRVVALADVPDPVVQGGCTQAEGCGASRDFGQPDPLEQDVRRQQSAGEEPDHGNERPPLERRQSRDAMT